MSDAQLLLTLDTDQRGSLPHTKFCKSLLDLALAFDQWDQVVSSIAGAAAAAKDSKHPVLTRLANLEAALRSLASRPATNGLFASQTF